MTSLVNRASRNFLLKHPWQLALALLGITLGVAVVIAIDIALESSLQSFTQAGRAISGTATHRIIGGDGGLDERIYRQLKVDKGLRTLSPVLQSTVILNQFPESRFTLLGIDPFAEKGLQASWQNALTEDQSALAGRLITEPNTLLISEHTAQKLELKVDDWLTISTGQGERKMQIIGLIALSDSLSRHALDNMLITDIATAQEVTGLSGKLSFIDWVLDDSDHQPSLIDAIRDSLPNTAELIAMETHNQAMRQMTEAFSINLNALGLLSLLVGMFLIYNTMTFLVIQRWRLIGSLRLLGVSRKQVFTMIVQEALLLALAGTGTGILLGIVLAQGLLHLVSATVNSIFFRIEGGDWFVSYWQIGKAIGLGVCATLLAVLPPALEAARLAPSTVIIRSQLESGIRRIIKIATSLSLIFILFGLSLAYFSETSIRLGLACIFMLLFGFALMTPGITLVIMKGVEWVTGRLFGVLGKLPPRLVTAEISRTGIAIAALMIAVSATIGMDLMISSFRQTVSDWLKISLQADLYVALPGEKLADNKAAADQQLKAAIAEIPGVARLSSVLHTRIRGEDGLIDASVFELNDQAQHGFLFTHTPQADIWQTFEQQGVFITEPYAYHHQLNPGQDLLLHTAQGQQAFKILAIYKDYSGDRGHIAMSRKLYLRYWPDLGFTGIGIYAQPDTDLNALEPRIAGLMKGAQSVRSNKAIYEASMEVFGQTFAVTEALRWLAAGIAFVGVFGALMALQYERTRQLGILRAIGVTPRQLSIMITSETGLMGLVAGIFSIPVGFIVAYVLIFVVYQRSFGWTMEFHVNTASLFQGLLLALTAALLAGILPSLKMAKTSPAIALRNE
ncbi:FtsX-like permease family protein [Methylicorpusculum sp.]|uniref:FtsX-like permease family protein n=1 Tax=Methylicorpusculum sp. TaxID=2713644 RepID=UPI00271D4AF8|nr:ABC transporter permease [Methylicorpusculum sp.]MDO8844532.1 FtsX-like permease family protein [Methylicorpusculum sp.]